MAKSVESIISKFSSVIQELEDHHAKQCKKARFWNELQIKLVVTANSIYSKFVKTSQKEAQKAFEEAVRLRKILLGE